MDFFRMRVRFTTSFVISSYYKKENPFGGDTASGVF